MAAHVASLSAALLSALWVRGVCIWKGGGAERRDGAGCKNGCAGGGLMYSGGAVHVLYMGGSQGTVSLGGRARDDRAGAAGPALLLHQVLAYCTASVCAMVAVVCIWVHCSIMWRCSAMCGSLSTGRHESPVGADATGCVIVTQLLKVSQSIGKNQSISHQVI